MLSCFNSDFRSFALFYWIVFACTSIPFLIIREEFGTIGVYSLLFNLEELELGFRRLSLPDVIFVFLALLYLDFLKDARIIEIYFIAELVFGMACHPCFRL